MNIGQENQERNQLHNLALFTAPPLPQTWSSQAVPETGATLFLLGVGLIGIGFVYRKLQVTMMLLPNKLARADERRETTKLAT